ncbi:ribosomal RNA large subunit methyltransferase I [Desulfosarcina ovata subsp. sediminis]|uniref:Ribosomal RNA large subunit methyltransferase I n=1 Tax=Desulfosarcina ovata subsp. sediminis TaxID=885957 RepID=A0A5K8A234_9BACT|nr:class I SAM-dependent methyltransferase [Desulfosarcina ovata]BBO86330.1 ribosomal RNA large subunit methyltransferase I [Desulfosarcina ovata subsp. sediminis]
MATLVLKPKREKSLINRHPWIFSGAIQRVEGDPETGQTVDVQAANGRWLGRAAYSPRSQIRARLWTFDPAETVDDRFFERRLNQAIGLRQAILADTDTTAWRLVAAESDGLPGLIVDRYDRWLVCQFLTTGSERWKTVIADTLRRLVPECAGIYERSDVDVRKKEGLTLTAGGLWGTAPPELVEIRENGYRLLVDIRTGHKTGFYLDQRDNRARVAALASGKRMLNCFAYSGGFAVAALKAAAAHVVNIDSSAAALALADKNRALNGLEAARLENVTGDVFTQLRMYVAEKQRFDLIVLDPPKFVTAKADLTRAARGYKDINRLAFELLRPGGTLCTFSCSGLMGRDLFQKIVADAALDARQPAVILHWLSQAPDHPTGLAFPEGSYLKGLICRV